jgi:hypothetical protein
MLRGVLVMSRWVVSMEGGVGGRRMKMTEKLQKRRSGRRLQTVSASADKWLGTALGYGA